MRLPKIFRKKEDKKQEPKSENLKGLVAPVLLVIVFLSALLFFSYSPSDRMETISDPYIVVGVISSDRFVLETEDGDQEEYELKTEIHTTFYNYRLEKKFLGKTVYIDDGYMYYSVSKYRIETVNEFISEIRADELRSKSRKEQE